MHKTLITMAAVGLLSFSTQAQAQDNRQPGLDWEQSQEMLEDGARRVLDALSLLMHAIPTYEVPEVLPNGDILIRRKQPKTEDKGDVLERDRT